MFAASQWCHPLSLREFVDRVRDCTKIVAATEHGTGVLEPDAEIVSTHSMDAAEHPRTGVAISPEDENRKHRHLLVSADRSDETGQAVRVPLGSLGRRRDSSVLPMLEVPALAAPFGFDCEYYAVHHDDVVDVPVVEVQVVEDSGPGSLQRSK